MKTLLIEEKQYPVLLKNIKNPPKKLYIKGNEQILNSTCITVVGSRNMSEYGKIITKEIVKELTLAGVCIVSGLAVGIDSIAHQTCLENGGKTIAVLGSGLNKVFPPENKELYRKIINSGGAVISEYEPNVIAKKEYFPQRNRIVSGLSLGILVIEATYRSGTAITAKYALGEGRKVFCIPNSIGSKNSAGIINLLKKGAVLVTNAQEILYGVGIVDKEEDYEEIVQKQKIEKANFIEQAELSKLDKKTKKIYNYIKVNKFVNLEVMCEELKMSIQDVNVHITILELKGLVINKSGMNYVLKDELYV